VNNFAALILGLVEGITEFLPISSTFHLIFTSKLLGITETDFLKTFEVVIQSGAIMAAILLYWQKLKETKLLKTILISFLPTSIVGFTLYKLIKTVFFANTTLQIGSFILVGIIFILYEKFSLQNQSKKIGEINTKDALIIGLAQSLAVIPGVSRAGAVLLCGLILGYKRDQAAEYSFLLAIPTIISAGAFDLLKSDTSILFAPGNISLLLVGAASSFVSAYFVMRWFIGFMQKKSLILFGIYRLVAGFFLISI